MAGLQVFGVAVWHPDSLRTFLAELPYPLPVGSPLLDAAGARQGEIGKVWPSLNGRQTARIRLTAAALRDRPTLRADLLAHRTNLAIDATGRLLLVAQIDPASLPAAPTQRHPLWLAPPRVVASRW